MEKHYDGRAFGYIRKVLSEPIEGGFVDVAHVEIIATDVEDIVDCDVVDITAIERIVCGADVFFESGFGVFVGWDVVLFVVIAVDDVDRVAEASAVA